MPRYARIPTFDPCLTRLCRDHYASHMVTAPLFFTMELFEFRQPYQVLICSECQYCVRPSISALTTHLRAQHKSHQDVRPRSGAKGAAYVAQQLLDHPLRGRVTDSVVVCPHGSRTSCSWRNERCEQTRFSKWVYHAVP